MGAMDVIEKPIVPYFVKSRVESVMELFRARKRLNRVVRQQHGQFNPELLTILEKVFIKLI